MKFKFSAKDQKGATREGHVEAINKQFALEVLQKNGLIPLTITRAQDMPKIFKDVLRAWEGVKQKDLVILFRQLSILIEARVPISVALNTIKEQTANKYLEKIVEEIRQDIDEGSTLSDAMAKQKDTFSPLMVNMVASGEVSGNLQKSLNYLAKNIEKNYQLTSRIRGAMIYPAIVFFVFIVVGFFVVTFIIPKISMVIKEMEAEIPWYTKLVIKVGDFMSVYWWAVAIAILAMVGGFMYYIRSEKGKREWDQIKIKLPVFGKLFRYLYITRFADNFGTLLSGGIPIVRSLHIVSSVVNNYVYQVLIMEAADEVKSGNNISKVFLRSIYVPPMVAQMIKVGEDTGKLDTALINVATFYESETDQMTKNLTTLLEPVIMIFMAVGVAILVFSVLLPIYNIVGQIQ